MGCGGSGSRRCAITARDASTSCDWLVVTHPLRRQRLAVLFERDYPDGRRFVCEGGPRGSIGVWEDSTDRAPAPGMGEVLAGWSSSSPLSAVRA
jgi:hypothetical protein